MALLQAERKKTQKKTKKVLIIAHNHPLFFPGGAEIFAYDLFKTMGETTHYQPFFLGAAAGINRQVHTGTPFQMLVDSPDEALFWGDAYDYFYNSQKILNFIYVDFKGFLEELNPDVIHFHHTMRIGLEAIQVARQTLRAVKIVYTIHEFILMCNRDGQMIRKHNNELCEYAAPDRCHQCFPEISPQQFKMREAFIKAHLDLVDLFISPSHFLANRFIDWGIPAEKMVVMENGRQISGPAPHRVMESGKSRNVFGFFGQINPYKGVILLLEAVIYLVKNDFTDLRVEIFGNVAEGFPDLKEKFFELIEEYQENVTYHGKYKQEEIGELIEGIDWVVVPSTWWENSPLVIQEVFMHKRPIICSNIGGMAEKVEDDFTGLHFRARSQVSLANTMKKACTEEGLWERLVGNIGPRLSLEESANQHVALYDKL
ncbi:MAG: glycosyltransferase family 4 protein [Gomphosphaeria aponina SAG 52.96 = DSM 107014]|uniref:Glycosyltransferase family 4 protein n=1 Tax=Gomphosphaeria aponina SAG 52.96 = DSM 107014 TaxID=1521640 RepID=A0A941JRR4_9CHRO|nr:glycosyltransferase family 4 protein [Gomphosphaeria aponina SAG 52.96 = DSM 107014]